MSDGPERWLDAQLAAAGIERTGPVERTQVRPWATVLRAPTSTGTVWLKASGGGTAFEAGLYELLHRVAPEHVLEPIAVDAERAWVLLPDGGPSLGARLKGADLIRALESALPEYGRLQRALAPHAGELLALGIADMRPAVLPQRFDEAVEAARGQVDDADREAFERSAAMRDTIVAWCERLAAAPAPASLDHNDLHPWNILVGDGHARFYDWGDSVVAHPFASMLLGLGFVQFNVLESAPDAPEIVRLRDAYLEVFSDLAPHAELVETLELACRVGKIARALTWQRAVTALAEEDVDDQWRRAPLETVISIAEESYLGRT